MLLAIHDCVPRKTIWRKPWSNQWWKDVESGKYGEEWCRDYLRMTERTFCILCNELHPYIRRKSTALWKPISVQRRVAITVWKLATNVEYQTVSTLLELVYPL